MTDVEREGGGWEIAGIWEGGFGKKEKAFYLVPFSLFSLFPLPTPPHFYCAVTVIWASPRFGHPHSQNSSDMGIPCNPNPNPNPNRKGRPRRLRVHFSTGLVVVKHKCNTSLLGSILQRFSIKIERRSPYVTLPW